MNKLDSIINKLFNSKLLELKREFIERYRELKIKTEGQSASKLRETLAALEIKSQREEILNTPLHNTLIARETAKSAHALHKELEEIELKEVEEAKNLRFMECDAYDSRNKMICNLVLSAIFFVVGIVATKLFDYFF